MPALSTVGNVRQGYTVVRTLTQMTVGSEGLLLWTRHCLLYSGGSLIRELENCILQIRPGDLLEVTIDPLADTRVMRGNSRFPGAKQVRFFLKTGQGLDIQYVEMSNADMNPLSVQGNETPIEFLRMEEVIFDLPPVSLMAGSLFALPRAVAPAVTALPGAFGTADDWIMLVSLSFEELFDADFCERMILTVNKATGPSWSSRFFIPKPDGIAGTLKQSQVLVGMELVNGVTSFNLVGESTSTRPAVCVRLNGARIFGICQSKVLRNPVTMKYIKYSDGPERQLATEAPPSNVPAPLEPSLPDPSVEHDPEDPAEEGSDEVRDEFPDRRGF